MHPLYSKLLEKLRPRDVNLSSLEIELKITPQTLSKALRNERKIPLADIEKLIKHLKIE